MKKSILIISSFMLMLFISSCKNSEIKAMDLKFYSMLNEEGFLCPSNFYATYLFYINNRENVKNKYVLNIKIIDSIALISVKTLYYKKNTFGGAGLFVDSLIVEKSKIWPIDSILSFKNSLLNIVNDKNIYKEESDNYPDHSILYLNIKNKRLSLGEENIGHKNLTKIDSLFLKYPLFMELDENIKKASNEFLVRNTR